MKRQITKEIASIIIQTSQFLHVIIGPRQVGKSTAAKQIAEELGIPTHSVSADGPEIRTAMWLEEQWRIALMLGSEDRPALLIIDEMQKITGWGETVKLLWDKIKDQPKNPLRVILLGSSSLLIQDGLTESLAGRFLLHRFSHWSLSEMNELCGLGLNQWLYFGGYPGGASLVPHELTWRSYILDSLIETTLSRDILQLQKVTKPSLLRTLFFTAVQHPAEIISYTKLMGLIPEAGNAGTVAHYTQLLASTFLLQPLALYPSHSSRASKPKIIVRNNALITAVGDRNFDETMRNSQRMGRLAENAVGAHLLNGLHPSEYKVNYFRERVRGRDLEVDFVITRGDQILALEVTTAESHSREGLEAFKERVPNALSIIVGPGGIPLVDFLSTPPDQFLSSSF